MICPSSSTGDRTVALESVDAAVMARTALFSPELDRLFVTVPHLGWTTAKVLVFKPQEPQATQYRMPTPINS